MLVPLLLTVLSFSCGNCIAGYYWREYSGVVPDDAFVAGQDISGDNVYIGQGYVKNSGLVVAEIKNGTTAVVVPMNGPKKVKKYIKVLCGLERNFYWMNANKSTLHLELFGKHAVIGGQEDTYGYMNIGRITVQGKTKIGKVNSFWLENAEFFYIEDKKEKNLGSYEILMYKEDEIDIRNKECRK